MTENAKLRALLAEAREVVQGVLRAANSTPYAQWSRDQHQAEIVRDAIDAALAEPVEAMQAAEIDREHWTYKVLSQGLEIEAKKIREGMVRQAYQRGAEAMREAAMGAAWHSAAMGLHKRIKEMPLPEDKR